MVGGGGGGKKKKLPFLNQIFCKKETLLTLKKRRDIEIGNEELEESDLIGEVRGSHIAKLQATIVERDLELHKLQAQINTREEQLSRLKTLAARRIESLEIELRRIRGQQKSE